MNTKRFSSASIFLVILLTGILVISVISQFKFYPVDAAALDGVIEIDLLAVDSGNRTASGRTGAW